MVLRPGVNEGQQIGQGSGARGIERGVLPEAVPGHHGRLRRDVMLDDPVDGDIQGQDGNLRVDRQIERRLRAVETERRDIDPQNPLRLVEGLTDGCEFLVQIATHPHMLDALPRKDISQFSHEGPSSLATGFRIFFRRG